MENLPAVNRQEKKKSEGKVKVKDKIIENNTRMPIRKFVWGLPAGPAGGLSRGGPAASLLWPEHEREKKIEHTVSSKGRKTPSGHRTAYPPTRWGGVGNNHDAEQHKSHEEEEEEEEERKFSDRVQVNAQKGYQERSTEEQKRFARGNETEDEKSWQRIKYGKLEQVRAYDRV